MSTDYSGETILFNPELFVKITEDARACVNRVVSMFDDTDAFFPWKTDDQAKRWLMGAVNQVAAKHGRHVLGVFLIGSRAHRYQTDSSDWDVKVITRLRDPRKYLSVEGYPKTIRDGSESYLDAPINISLQDVTQIIPSLCSMSAMYLFDYLVVQKPLYISPQLHWATLNALAQYKEHEDLFAEKWRAYYFSITRECFKIAERNVEPCRQSFTRVVCGLMSASIGRLINLPEDCWNGNGSVYVLINKGLGLMEKMVTADERKILSNFSSWEYYQGAYLDKNKNPTVRKSEMHERHVKKMHEIALRILPSAGKSPTAFSGDISQFNSILFDTVYS